MHLFLSIETIFESGQRLQNPVSIRQWCLIWSKLHSGTILIGLYYYVILSYYGCSSILDSLVQVLEFWFVLGEFFKHMNKIFLNWRLNSFYSFSFGLCYSTFLGYAFILTTGLPFSFHTFPSLFARECT